VRASVQVGHDVGVKWLRGPCDELFTGGDRAL